MLSPPRGLADNDLVSALADGWDLDIASVAYRPVGFGSHHWSVTEAGGARWFANVDELGAPGQAPDEPSQVLHRLRASFATATALGDHGLDFVVAPIPARGGEPLIRLGERFAVSLYPFVDGQSFDWGEYASADHRDAVLDMIVAVHTSPRTTWRHAARDDFTIAHRAELVTALTGTGGAGRGGPYTARAASLLAANAAPISRSLEDYDALVEEARSYADRSVLTHGEPHAGNTMLAPSGWKLIDWDTALVAPPERDLRTVDPGNGSVLAAYHQATGVTPLPSMIELYALQWDLTELAVCWNQFRNLHHGDDNDHEGWQNLQEVIENIDHRSG
ncbi:phosphotransferase family protein [Actinomadura scrupuli]|uniref:phosphotransferase family protein n=1 Tax=Actinomadura scrupuli TaxID=559629 RepID=UPI003D9613DC